MHEDRPFARLSFALSLWLSLLTAIVCAVVPAGLPSTRSVGSAFDPSTTIVALRSRPPAPIKATSLRIGEGDGAGIGGDPAALPARAAGVISAGFTLTPATAPLLSALILLPRAVPVALYARPPPAV